MKYSDDYQKYILSSLLIGLSVPSFSFLPLGFLAWFWLVPLLAAVERDEHVKTFAPKVLTSVAGGFSIIALWVGSASLIGMALSVLFGTLVWSVPLLNFFFVRRYLGKRIALGSLPFVWTAWEWLYHQTPFSVGTLRLGYTQADLVPFIQYADLTGVDGATFWLVTVNVLMYAAFKTFQSEKTNNFEIDPPKIRSVTATKYQSLIYVCLACAILLPPAYAAYVLQKTPPPFESLKIVAVQPNASPFVGHTPRENTKLLGKQMGLTDRALSGGGEDKPDLIVWQEVAVPFVLSESPTENRYLARQIQKWDVPLLTGFPAVKDYAPDEKKPFLLEQTGRSREYFNAARIFEPSKIENDTLDTDLSALYFKRRLMPFVERPPLVDSFPALAGLIIPVGSRPDYTPGTRAVTFDFQTRAGATVTVGTMLCYENLYPEMSAEAVRAGAEILTGITNEGFFSGTPAQYQLAAFSRFRAIETRRDFVRVAATGATRTYDKFGRITAEVPMWSEQIMRATVAPSREITVYVRYGNWLAALCWLMTALIFLLVIERKARTLPNIQ